MVMDIRMSFALHEFIPSAQAFLWLCCDTPRVYHVFLYTNHLPSILFYLQTCLEQRFATPFLSLL